VNNFILFLLRIYRPAETVQQSSTKGGNMLNFQRIDSVSNPHFLNLFNLYTQSFPSSERRSWAGLEMELMSENSFNAHVLLQNDKFVGFLNYWTFERFLYIEHFAVSSNLRGKNIGTEAMKILMEQTKLPILFEVEMPNNIMAVRRIGFYERLGFSVLSHNYAQPPYEGNGFIVPMLIMCNNTHFANTHFEMIKNTLYDEVYHYEREEPLTAIGELY